MKHGVKRAIVVASFTDAWIETSTQVESALVKLVASFTDAWIETFVLCSNKMKRAVASFTDAWIETLKANYGKSHRRSHLLQMRGLKHTFDEIKEAAK